MRLLLILTTVVVQFSVWQPSYGAQCILHLDNSRDKNVLEIFRLSESIAGVEVCQDFSKGTEDRTYSVVSKPLFATKGVCTYSIRRLFLSENERAQKTWTYASPQGFEYLAGVTRKMKLAAGTVCPPPASDDVRVFNVTGGVFLRLFEFGTDLTSSPEKFEQATSSLPPEIKASKDFELLVEAVRVIPPSGLRIAAIGFVDAATDLLYYTIDFQGGDHYWSVIVDIDVTGVVVRGFGSSRP